MVRSIFPALSVWATLGLGGVVFAQDSAHDNAGGDPAFSANTAFAAPTATSDTTSGEEASTTTSATRSTNDTTRRATSSTTRNTSSTTRRATSNSRSQNSQNMSNGYYYQPNNYYGGSGILDRPNRPGHPVGNTIRAFFGRG